MTSKYSLKPASCGRRRPLVDRLDVTPLGISLFHSDVFPSASRHFCPVSAGMCYVVQRSGVLHLLCYCLPISFCVEALCYAMRRSGVCYRRVWLFPGAVRTFLRHTVVSGILLSKAVTPQINLNYEPKS